MKLYDLLVKAGDELDIAGFHVEADVIDKILKKVSADKWMQDAVNPKEKGELHQKLNVPKDETIPVSKLESKKQELHEKSKGEKTLTDAERELLGQIQFALNARKAKR